MEQWRTSELTDAAESYARALEQARRAIGATELEPSGRNLRTWAFVGGIAAAAGVVIVGLLRAKRAQDIEITGGVQ